MKADQDVYLVTGGMGCIGAWTLFHLQRQGRKAVSFDLSTERHRVNLLIDPEDQDGITFLQGDLTDFGQVFDVFQSQCITHVIHLAALQVPFCKADPVRGAQVNVVGTVNVFEAARQCGLNHLTYASSIAVYGPPGDYPQEFIPHDAPFNPRTLYGVYKVANESTAQIYWQDHQVSSTALRPYIVYGPARDQGLTSDPTKAMLAAVLGEPSHIGFGGSAQYHYASDVSQQFIMAAVKAQEGANGYNLGTQPATSEDIIAIIEGLKPGVKITASEAPLPFPVCDGGEYLRQFPNVEFMPLERGIRETIIHFEKRN